MATNLAVIQARIGSSRLPGKVMYPLNGEPVISHIITRVAETKEVDNIVLATSLQNADEVLEIYGEQFGAEVIRGSESNVQERFWDAVQEYNPTRIVRVPADNPLLSPRYIDIALQKIDSESADYVSAGLDRTFPRGLTCEVFTISSFKRVVEASSAPRYHEHVTPYYREHPDQFRLYNLESSEVFEEEWLQDRTDLRLTLDEPADYQLLETVYRELEYEGIIGVREAIQYIDLHDLSMINAHVEQKSV